MFFYFDIVIKRKKCNPRVQQQKKQRWQPPTARKKPILTQLHFRQNMNFQKKPYIFKKSIFPFLQKYYKDEFQLLKLSCNFVQKLYNKHKQSFSMVRKEKRWPQARRRKAASKAGALVCCNIGGSNEENLFSILRQLRRVAFCTISE